MECVFTFVPVLFWFTVLLPASRETDSLTTTTAVSENLNITFTNSNVNMTSLNVSINNVSNNTEDNTNANADVNGQPSPFALIQMGTVSEATYNSFIIITSYIQYPLYIIALILNVFNVVVYCQKQMRSPTSTILIALCGTEAIYVTLSLIAETFKLVYAEAAMNNYVFLTYGLYVSNYLTVSFRRVGFCYTFLVSAERFIAVTFPLQAKSFRLVKYPAVVCVLILVSCVALHLFSALKYVVIPYRSQGNTTAYRFKYTDMYVQDKVHFENVSMACKFLFVYLMLLGCLIFNLLIVISLKRHKRNRQAMKTSQNSVDSDKRDRQTTITIMVSTFVDVLLALPLNTNGIVNNLSDDYGIFTKEHYLFFLLSSVGATCDLVSICTNFIFYIVLSAKFRQTFVEVFMPCVNIREGRDGHQGSTDTTLSNISRTN